MKHLKDYVIDWNASKETTVELFENYMDAFYAFEAEYNNHYGSVKINDNLIEIHTGGWSENESLVNDLKSTAFWKRVHKIVADGGHYYLDLDRYDKDKKHYKIVIT